MISQYGLYLHFSDGKDSSLLMHLLAICISLENVSSDPFKDTLKSMKKLVGGLDLVPDRGRTLP